MHVEGAPMIAFFRFGVFVQVALLNVIRSLAVQCVLQVETLIGLVLENHHFDACLCACFRMKLYPFVKFENRAYAFGGGGLVVESLAAATVAKQAQSGHYGLFALFDIHEVEFAKFR